MFFAGLHNTWTTDTWSTRLTSPSVDPLNGLTTPEAGLRVHGQLPTASTPLLFGRPSSWDPARIRATNDASGLRVDLDSLSAQNTPGRRVRQPRLGIGRRVVTGRSCPLLLATIYLSLGLSERNGTTHRRALKDSGEYACGLPTLEYKLTSPTPSPTNRHKSTEYHTFASILASG